MTDIQWQNEHGKNPHERLDRFVELWRDHQDWATGVKAQLAKMQLAGAPDENEADNIVVLMQEAQDQLARVSQQAGELRLEIIELKFKAGDYDEPLNIIRAELTLANEGKNPEQRKANLGLALAQSADYCQTNASKRKAEKQKMIKEAKLEQLNQDEKMIYQQLYNLRARLENLTARINLVLGESK